MKTQTELELVNMLETELADFQDLIRSQNPSEALAKLRVFAELTERVDAQSVYALTYMLLN
jgi:hypothetical protein